MYRTIKITVLLLLINLSVDGFAQTRTANPNNIAQISNWMKDGTTQKIIFPEGIYTFTQSISLENNNLILEGDGSGKTIFKLGEVNTSLIDAKGNYAHISNLTLDGNFNQKSWGNSIFLFNKSKGHHFEKVNFKNSKWNAISAVNAYATDGLVTKQCTFSNIDYHCIKIFNRNTNHRNGEVIVSVDKILIDGCIFEGEHENAISCDNGNDRKENGDGTGRRYTESTSLNGTIIQNCVFGKSNKFSVGMVQTADVIFRNNLFKGTTDEGGGGCQPMHFEQFTHNIEIYDNVFEMANTVSKKCIYIRMSGTEGHKRVTQQRPSSTYKTWTYKIHGSNERRANVQCATDGNINKDCKRDVHAYGPRNIYIAGNTFNASDMVSQYLFFGEGENIQIGTKKDGTIALNKFLGGDDKMKKIALAGHDEGTADVLIKSGQNILKSNVDIKKVSFDLKPKYLLKPIVNEE